MIRRCLYRTGFALLVLFLASTKFVDITVGAGFGLHPAEMAWSATGLKATGFSLDYWAATRDGDIPGDLEQWARRIGSRLGARDTRIFTGRASGVRFANLDGRLAADGELILTIQVENTRAHIGISCSYGGIPPRLADLERRIRFACLGLAPRGRFYWTAVGRSSVRLSAEAWRAMWVRVLRAVNAVRRDGETGSAEGTILAYSPLLPLPAEAAPQNANLAISCAYDRVRRLTTVTISSPGRG